MSSPRLGPLSPFHPLWLLTEVHDLAPSDTAIQSEGRILRSNPCSGCTERFHMSSLGQTLRFLTEVHLGEASLDAAVQSQGWAPPEARGGAPRFVKMKTTMTSMVLVYKLWVKAPCV